MISSPLRYPGGKASMTGLIGKIRKLNGLGARAVAEPFAGGAGASLSLLYQEETQHIHLNDADPAIFDFWWTLVNRPGPFLQKIAEVDLNMDEWRVQRGTYCSTGRTSRLKRGFAAFYLNRCNRSGIIMNGGPIGGIEQNGTWKIDARFNRLGLQTRCKKVSEYASRISVSGLDGIQFVASLDQDSTLFFIDPPYFHKGSLLYLNLLNDQYHAQLADRLKSMSGAAWIVTYDDCPEIRRLYEGWATIRPFGLRYAAADRRSGKEILIVPKGMKLPAFQSSDAISW